MRLRELKCKNCGATLEVDENALQIECEFCHTEFAVEDAYHDGYKFEKGRMKAHREQMEKDLEHVKGVIAPVGKAFAAQSIISAVVCLIIFAIVVITIITLVTKQVNSVDEFDIRVFNSTYEMYMGTEYGSSVGRLIDEVSTNNKKDKEHKIIIKYKEISTQEPEQMKEIKKQLDQWTKYEVTFEYDEDGFIYIATIEE
jgi:hypothetical protein